MSNEFISQDEVDALLQGVSEEETAGAVTREGARPCDVASQERIVRGRMPALELVNERFGRQARSAIETLMRKAPEVSVGAVRAIKYSEFAAGLPVPANLNLVGLKPMRGAALFVLDPGLVSTVVDHLFGGDNRFHSGLEGREFGGTEMRIIHRLLEALLEEYRRAWQPVQPMAFDLQGSETHAQFLTFATPNEIVLVTTFTLQFGEGRGDLHVCLPYASLEPIRDKLFSGPAGDPLEPDKRWARLLRAQVQEAPVEITARLAELPIDVRNLMAMRAGDVIGFDLPRRVTAAVHGVPLFECRYGTLNGRYAIKVDRVLAASLKTGEPDAQ